MRRKMHKALDPQSGRERHSRWVRGGKRKNDLIALGKHRAKVGEKMSDVYKLRKIALLLASALSFAEPGQYRVKGGFRIHRGLNGAELTNALFLGRFAELGCGDDIIRWAIDSCTVGTWISPDRAGEMVELSAEEREVCRISSMEAIDESRADRLARQAVQKRFQDAARQKRKREQEIASGKRQSRQAYRAQFAARREKAALLGISVNAVRMREARAAAKEVDEKGGPRREAACRVASEPACEACGVLSACDHTSEHTCNIGSIGHHPARSSRPVIVMRQHPDVQGDAASTSSEQRSGPMSDASVGAGSGVADCVAGSSSWKREFTGISKGLPGESLPESGAYEKKTARLGGTLPEEPTPLIERLAEPSRADNIRAGSTAVLSPPTTASLEPGPVEAPRALAHANASVPDLFGARAFPVAPAAGSPLTKATTGKPRRTRSRSLADDQLAFGFVAAGESGRAEAAMSRPRRSSGFRARRRRSSAA